MPHVLVHPLHFLDYLFLRSIKVNVETEKGKQKVVTVFLIASIYCIVNQFKSWCIIYRFSSMVEKQKMNEFKKY